MALPDLIRMLGLIIFAWAAYADFKTRRMRNVIWVVAISLGFIALVIDVQAIQYRSALYYSVISFLISAGVIGTMGVIFARLQLFGWADAGALMSIGFLYPVTEPLLVGGFSFPPTYAADSIMSLNILLNASLVVLCIPIVSAVFNYSFGTFSFPQSLYLFPIHPSSLWRSHGRLYVFDDGSWINGADVDVIKRYLQWRMLSLSVITSAPEQCKSPHKITEAASSISSLEYDDKPWQHTDDLGIEMEGVDVDPTDEWGVSLFFEQADVPQYNTSEQQLRDSLDQLFIHDERARLSYGIPYVSVLFIGLCVTLATGGIVPYL